MTRVAIYSRLSHDITGGFQTATVRQAEACRSYAAARDWEVLAEFEDVELSAADPRVRRPDFEEMLRRASSGEFDGILVWKLDRLVRRPSQFETTWQILDDAHTFLASATEPVDTSNPLGLAVVRMLVTFASLETATQSLRLKSKFSERAEQGLPHGVRRTFGLNSTWTKLNHQEANLIREAATRVIAGEAVLAITNDWNRRGIPTVMGKPWQSGTLKNILQSGRVAGQRSHNGIDVAKGSWPAALDPDTAARVRAALARRYRREPAVHCEDLLARLLFCSLCGRSLRGRRTSGRVKRIYRCPEYPRGCGRLSIVVPYADEAVTASFLTRLRRRQRLCPPPDVEAVEYLDEYVTQVEELWRTYMRAGEISRRDYDRQVNALDDRRRRVEVQALMPTTWDLVRKAGGLEAIAASWADLPIGDRQQLLRSEIARAVVSPAIPHRRFDPRRIRIHWWVSDDDSLGLPDVVAALGVGAAVVRRLLHEGLLIGEKLGGEWVVDRREVEIFVESHKIMPAAGSLGTPTSS